MARVWMASGAANAHSYREKQPRDLGPAKGPRSSGIKGFARFCADVNSCDFCFWRVHEILPRLSRDRKVDLVLQRYAARADVGAMWRELLLYSHASRNSSDFQVQRPRTALPCFSRLHSSTCRHAQADVHIRSTRAAHPTSAAWSSITTRRGGLRLSRMACLPLCFMTNWP